MEQSISTLNRLQKGSFKWLKREDMLQCLWAPYYFPMEGCNEGGGEGAIRVREVFIWRDGANEQADDAPETKNT